MFHAIGVHARDGFGRRASQCQSLEWLIDWIKVLDVEVAKWIDPWDPVIDEQRLKNPPLPIIDPLPIVHTALGTALVALRQAHPYPPEKIGKEQDAIAQRAITEGGKQGLKLALKDFNHSMKSFSVALKA